MYPSPSVTEFLKTASGAARHFGFEHIDDVKKHPACKSCDQKVTVKTNATDRRTDALHGLLTAGICDYFDNRLNGIDGPVLFYKLSVVPRTGETALSLHVVNVEKSIAEAILIQTTRAILEDLGFTNQTLRINSLGDQESVNRYIRELTNFFRKRAGELPASARELMKEHVLIALMHLIEKQHELAHRSPSPLEYLSDQSRKHFREIIEYLDMSNISYEIDPKLLGHHQCYSDAIFSFDLSGEPDGETVDMQPVFTQGGRYNAFVSRFGRSDVPAAGAVVVLREKKAPARMPHPRRGAVPSVFVVQLGFGPKIRSLLLVDELKRSGIPVLQDIISDSLSQQLRKAEAQNVRYAVILGQKEFVEGSVILRDLHARSQETVPADTLPKYLRRTLG